MLHWFEVENFTSFRSRVRISFEPGKVVDDYSVFTSAAGERLNKFCAMFGPNAAGKTNLLRAAARVARFIAHSFNWPEDEPLPFSGHFFVEQKPARIALQFEVPDWDEQGKAATSEIFRYEVEAIEQRVLRESLRVKTSHLFSRVFERQWTGEGYTVTGLGERFKKDLPERVSFLAWLNRHEVSLASRLTTYFRNYRSNDIAVIGRLPAFVNAHSAVSDYRRSETLRRRMVSCLRQWDLGIDDVEFASRKFNGPDGKEQEYWEAMVSHRLGEKTAKLPLSAESSGTIGLFAQLSVLLQVLERGGVALIDELEADLHPDMIEIIVELFRSPETNPRNAQLVFTTHADWVMNLLNKWQIVLVEKRDCASEAWRLADMQGVLARENHAARYRAGAYGAVPRARSPEPTH